MAVTVPKRVGTAVRRNYARRRIREYYRRNRDLFASTGTIIFHFTGLPDDWDELFRKVSKWAGGLRGGASNPPV